MMRCRQVLLMRRFFSSQLKESNELMDLPGSVFEKNQGMMIKDTNPFELDESKKSRYTVSTIKLFDKDATLKTTELALKAKEESEMVKPTFRNIDTRVKSL